MVKEGPGEFKFLREVGGEGFDPERFGGVVATIEDVDAEFFGHGVGPMRSFASDESVDAFVGGFFEIAPCSAGDDADSAADFGSAGNEERFRTGCVVELRGKSGTREAGIGLKAKELAVIEKEGARSF